MSAGLDCRSTSNPSPSLSIVPTRKFSMTTSTLATMRRNAAFAAGCRRSSAMPRLLRFIIRNALASPLTSGGDDTRRFSPPEVNGEANAFLMMNRNKRGIALDLRQPAAKAALRRIVAKVDVVIENFRVGTMDKLGLGFDVLRQSNPALIYCAVSGYGLTGPD